MTRSTTTISAMVSLEETTIDYHHYLALIKSIHYNSPTPLTCSVGKCDSYFLMIREFSLFARSYLEVPSKNLRRSRSFARRSSSGRCPISIRALYLFLTGLGLLYDDMLKFALINPILDC